MAISATYLTLQRQIADELGDRTDLLSPLSDSSLALSPIQNAIQTAIAKWERAPFYFNEYYADAIANPSWSFATVATQEFYTTSGDAAGAQTGNLLKNSPEILKMLVTISTNRFSMNRRSWQYLEDISLNPKVYGQPFDWAYYAETIRLYPIPDAIYSLSMSAVPRFAVLALDADANVWTQDGYDLIRSEAKLILARETLHDDALASRTEVAIYGNPGNPRDTGYFGALKAETSRRAQGRIRPTYF